jgi:hypothetical protein
MKRGRQQQGSNKKQQYIPHKVIETMKPEDGRYLFVAYAGEKIIHYYTCPELSERSEEDTWFLKSILAYQNTDPYVYFEQFDPNDPFDFGLYFNKGTAPMNELIEMLHDEESLNDFFNNVEMVSYIDHIFQKFKGSTTKESVKKLSPTWKVLRGVDELQELTKNYHFIVSQTNC